jgi:hypothetical protein
LGGDGTNIPEHLKKISSRISSFQSVDSMFERSIAPGVIAVAKDAVLVGPSGHSSPACAGAHKNSCNDFL